MDYKYDIYVLYSGMEEDRMWVHSVLLATLEKQYGLNVHIHLRDFIIGEYIVDNIVHAIVNSRKVIAVITPNFLKSKWCVDEVYMTHAQDEFKLICLLLKEIPVADANIPSLLRVLMERKTYLEWSEDKVAKKLFWKRLIHAIHKVRV